jgi:Holliday junction resolvase YEN1
LKEVLTYFGIPYHEAPEEGEAECCRLQILGIVGAVWSQHSDCLMFGCTYWSRGDRVSKTGGTNNAKENTVKRKQTARVVRARDLQQRLGIDPEGLVRFLILVRGDYDTEGLPGCGPSVAMRALEQGLGRSLCQCQDQRDCGAWGVRLADFLRTTPHGRSVTVPMNFTDLKHYRSAAA